MKIIAGQQKGRRLKTPKDLTTRPTPARVREALFSIIAAHIPNAKVLDLFAGTGALGIEALSRGAQHCTFVEKSHTTSALILQNLVAFTPDTYELFTLSAERAVKQLGHRNSRFDLVFIDPPYASQLWEATLKNLAEHQLVSRGGLVVCEHPGKLAVPKTSGTLVWIETRVYGDVAVSLYGVPTGEGA